MATNSTAEPTRRDMLYIATGAASAVAVGAVAWPLIAQMNPDASTLALERQINPFLRTREDTVIRAAQAFDATASGETGVFAAIRQWKNEFK